jgi:ketosteroid isomerase-like protein
MATPSEGETCRYLLELRQVLELVEAQQLGEEALHRGARGGKVSIRSASARSPSSGVDIMTPEAQNIDFIKDLHAAFGRGDLPYILERFAPELEEFGVMANGQARAPWHITTKTREGVAKYFELLLGALEPLRFEPQHFAAAGDYVYATLEHAYKVRKNGKTLPMKNGVHRFKVENGRVVAWFAAEDTQLTKSLA